MRSSFLCLTVLLMDYSPAGNLQITKVIIMDSGIFFKIVTVRSTYLAPAVGQALF